MAMFVNLRVANLEAEVVDIEGAVGIDGALSVGGAASLEEGVALDATAVSGVKVLAKDGAGNALLATGETVPTDADAGYAKGCLFIDTNVGAGTSGLYCNIGTTAACNFNLVTVAAD